MAKAFKSCSVDGCNKNAHWSASGARGWCGNHWSRWRNHGDPLGGKTPDGYALQWLEEHVSYVSETCLPWPFTTNPQGYGQVWLEGQLLLATRVMCERAHGPVPEGKPYALHSCGCGHLGCINQGHLFWGTPKRNQLDRVKDGTSNRGRANGSARITEAKVREIRRLAGQITHEDIAIRVGISRGHVGDIISRKRWAWLL
ncbi:helix-turn-helix transcriptional regulator [Mesorhizobium sp. M0189]|uniref:helix-turn-helix domain-containing protein n=1 Tax=Mesorhizobium sp. M0189 TaxID=2956909 RepID=UPI00333C5F49